MLIKIDSRGEEPALQPHLLLCSDQITYMKTSKTIRCVNLISHNQISAVIYSTSFNDDLIIIILIIII